MQQLRTNNTPLKTCGGAAAIGVASLLIVAAALFWLIKALLPSASVSDNSRTYVSSTQVESIRRIGQWEFLSINAEEMVDTTRRGLLSNDHLVRIYYGTLRIGVDLTTIDSTCVTMAGDTLVLVLPDVGLLDSDFIDEARTRSFHESGTWSGKDRNDLHRRAQQRMMARSLTPENLEATRQLAEDQLLKVLHAMGFEKAAVRFER